MVKRSRDLIALPLALALAACDPFAPTAGPPYYLAPPELPEEVYVGDTLTIDVHLLDAEQRPLAEAAVYWTPSDGGAVDPAVTTTNGFGRAVTRWAVGTRAGEQSVVAATSPLETTLTVELRPGRLDRLLAEPATLEFDAIGDTLQIGVRGMDRFDNEITLHTLRWRSSDAEVVTVADGAVVSRAEGSAWISVNSGNRSRLDSVRVTVEQRMAGIGIVPASPVMVLGETLVLEARAVDPRGTPLDTAISVAWASSDESIATVDDRGTVHTHGLGTVTVSASSGRFAEQAALRVTDRTRPTITAIAPALLGPGDTARIEGAHFGSEEDAVTVTIDGVALELLTVADDRLTARLPAPGHFPCDPAGPRDLMVDVDGLRVTATHTVAAAELHTLAPGASITRFGDGVACNTLQEPGDYVITVFNTTTTPTSWTGFQLRGQGPEGADIAAPAVRFEAPPAPESDATAPARTHLRLLEASRALPERRGGPEPARSWARLRSAAAEAGDTRTFRMPDIRALDYCTSYLEVRARAVYAGEYAVIWEDTDAPLAGTMDEVWAEIGAEYDQVMHPILAANFGDPLVYDDRLDGNGRIDMLFTHAVNAFGLPLNGFAWTGDFYDRGECASSDQGEIFYGRVATGAGNGESSATVEDWRWSIRATLIHEVKHLTAYAHRFDLDPLSPTLEATGLEEATARLAEELYGRALLGYTPLGNVGFEESLACEVGARPGEPACDGVPLIMAKHYGAINRHLRSPETTSPFGPANPSDATYYGSGWQLLRWAIDHSGRSEADFLRDLVREPTLIGPANLAARAGRDVAALLADYSLALALDDHPSASPPERSELTMPSWDTRDIFAGLHDHYAGSDEADPWDRPWPLASRPLEPGGFTFISGIINGGGIAVFTLEDLAQSQLLQLLSAGGETAPGSLGLAVARIR